VTHVINIQGDEPLIDPALVDTLARSLLADPELPMITAANPLTDPSHLDDPDIVKVVLNRAGNALYFSRSALPHCRTTPDDLQLLRHMGIYGYRRDFLERAEHLEQLRALENGARIRVVMTEDNSIGLDTPAQVPQLEALLAASTTSL
jgi:3-deoxy-manno-octulosonate cytidylyltransferase (CMP-KDO synthetase)